MKKLISMFLVMATVLTTAVIPVSAEEETAELSETYGGLTYKINDDNTITITDCDTSATDVTIPAEINGRSVTSIGDSAFSFCDSLATVTIPNSVTSIGEGVFMDCYSLENIIMPDSVANIGWWRFWIV